MILMKKSFQESAWWRKTRIGYHWLGFDSDDSRQKHYHIAIEYKQIAVTRGFIENMAYEVLIWEEFQTWLHLNRLDYSFFTPII